MVGRGYSLHRNSCALLILLLTTTGLPSTYGKWRPYKHTLAGMPAMAAEGEERPGPTDAGGNRASLAPQGVVVDHFGELVELAIPGDEDEEPLPVRTTSAQHGDPIPAAGVAGFKWERVSCRGGCWPYQVQVGSAVLQQRQLRSGGLVVEAVLHPACFGGQIYCSPGLPHMRECCNWCFAAVKSQWQLGGPPHGGAHGAV